MSNPNVAEIAQQARQWLASPEGQAAVAEGLARAQEMCEEFRKAQEVDWSDPALWEPLDAAVRLRRW